MPRLSIIVAMSRNGVIGAGGGLPWHLSDDLKRFKAVTMGKPVIMGRKTWDSIGKPLPGRRNLVVTRNNNLSLDGAECVGSLDEALDRTREEKEVFVIGGADLYRSAMVTADRMYRTRVDADVDGDVLFPETDWSEWQLLDSEEHAADERHSFPFFFEILDRLPSKSPEQLV